MRKCLLKCNPSNPSSRRRNRNINGSLKSLSPRGTPNTLLPCRCRKCNPRGYDMYKYPYSEQAVQASRKQTALGTSNGDIAHSSHPTRLYLSRYSDRPRIKRMAQDRSSGPLLRRRMVRLHIERRYSRRRRLSSSVYRRSRSHSRS
jgi:hypothetical protein